MDLRFCLRGLVREKLPPVRGCACPGCRGAPARRETKRQCARLRGQESVCPGWAWPRVGGAEGEGEGPGDNPTAWLKWELTNPRTAPQNC